MQLKFKLFNGEELSFKISKKSCIIGRSSQCDVVIPHEGMSRKHCMLTSRLGSLYVTDLGSTNGVFLDGDKIDPNKEILCPTYLTLSFGYVQTLQIELDENDAYEEEAAPPKLVTVPTSEPGLTTTRTKPLQLEKRPAPKKQNFDVKRISFYVGVLALAYVVYTYILN